MGNVSWIIKGLDMHNLCNTLEPLWSSLQARAVPGGLSMIGTCGEQPLIAGLATGLVVVYLLGW